VVVVVTPTPPLIPTPVQHPEAPGENSCLECHRGLGGKYLDIANQWEGSIHAAQDVTCADCHGGDPGANEKVAAKSTEAGYIGVPDRTAIPSLCASCHADPEEMLLYGLPADQLREYQKSVHGQLLAQGDENVATCFDCHGGHATQAIDNPKSRVYPRNQPVTCAACHADQERMKPYGVATDQYDLYQKSVHGRALMIHGNTEAPSCPTCHGSHGASLPGYSEVLDVCGQCHSASEEYYLTGGHRRGRQEGSETPRCTTCHGRYDVELASLDLFVGDEPRHCDSCHSSDSLEGRAVDEIYQILAGASQALQTTREALSEAQTLGMGLNEEEARLDEARARLAEAAAVQHTVQLETVKEKTDEVESISVEVQEAVEKAIARREQERLLPGGITAVVLALGGVVLVVLRRRRARGG